MITAKEAKEIYYKIQEDKQKDFKQSLPWLKDKVLQSLDTVIKTCCTDNKSYGIYRGDIIAWLADTKYHSYYMEVAEEVKKDLVKLGYKVINNDDLDIYDKLFTISWDISE